MSLTTDGPLRPDLEANRQASENREDELDQERLSNCCGAGAVGVDIYDRMGTCAQCFEHAEFLTEAEENVLYDERSADAKTA